LTVDKIEKCWAPAGKHAVRAWIHDQGIADASGEFDTYFFLDSLNNCIGRHTHNGLGAGEGEWAFSDDFVCSNRCHTIIVITDYNNDIWPESNENNNELTKTFLFLMA
jgi:hypothetical protein